MTLLAASPDAVKYFNLANGRAVVRWQHTGPVNTTIRTTVALDNCMPVAQDVYSTYRGTFLLYSVLRAAEQLMAGLHAAPRLPTNWSMNCSCKPAFTLHLCRPMEYAYAHVLRLFNLLQICSLHATLFPSKASYIHDASRQQRIDKYFFADPL